MNDTRERYVYSFGEGRCDIDPERKDILGGKGASLAAMSCAQLPVPPGFTISTACCQHYLANGERWPDGLDAQIRERLKQLEQVTGRSFGRGRHPLFVLHHGFQEYTR